jgi:hypothetical protein
VNNNVVRITAVMIGTVSLGLLTASLINFDGWYWPQVFYACGFLSVFSISVISVPEDRSLSYQIGMLVGAALFNLVCWWLLLIGGALQTKGQGAFILYILSLIVGLIIL